MQTMFKRMLSFAIALVLVLSMVPVSPLQVSAEGNDTPDTDASSGADEMTIVQMPRAELYGEGTEASPYLINNLEELKLFRDSVNVGETKYNAPGVYVALNADIDMAGTDWSVNIGDDCVYTFDGIFDGKGHTIKNLTATETAPKGDGYICTGLFGAIYGSAVVKNLTIENVTINTGDYTGNNVGAVVGFAYRCTGVIENVTVKGDIEISAKNVTGTGAIVGYDYYGKLTVKNCTVAGNEGSYITGAAYVGGVIGYASTNAVLASNTVEDMAVNATSCAAGGIAGIMLQSGLATGNTVRNVTLTSEHENWKNAAAVVVGTVTGPVTVSGTTFENVTANGEAISSVVGSEHADKPTEPVGKVEAQIGNTYYKTLAGAVAAAQNGETITLLTDVELTEALVIGKDKVITLDLNGNTISCIKDCTAAFGMIVNNGNLTINDSIGGGKISFTNTGAGSTGYAVNTINNCGVLTINGGTIENISKSATSQIGYAIDSYSGSQDAIVIINGGTVTATGSNYYDGIRLFAGSQTYKNDVVVNGGSVSTIWLQNTSDGSAGNNTKDVLGSVTITGGKVDALWLEPSAGFSGAVTGGNIGKVAYFDTAEGRDLIGFVSGGTFNTAIPEEFCAEGFIPTKNADGTYGVIDDPKTHYISNLEELKAFRDDVNSGKDYKGVTVYLKADIDLNNVEWTPIGYMDATFRGTFDGGNHTISNLKITKSLTNSAENNGIGLFGRTDSPAVIKNLTIENVDITGSLYVGAVVGMGYTGNMIENVIIKGDIAIDAWWYAGVVGGNGYMSLINNCHVIGNDGSYIKGNSGSYIGGIWGFRGEGGNNITNCSVTNLQITGVDRVGGICGIGHYGNTVANCTIKNVSVTATDPDATTVGLVVGATQGNASSPTVIKNVTFEEVVVTVGDTVVANPGLYGTNIDGSNAVTNFAAKIDNTYYETLAEAAAAAQAGETITLLTDVVLTEALVIGADKVITLDLNGKTVSMVTADDAKYCMVYNKGNLTVVDSGENGKLSYHYTGTNSGDAYNTIESAPGSVLTVKGGTIENLSTCMIAYAIDGLTNGSGGDVTVSIAGGKITSKKIAVRIFANSVTNTGTLNISGGDIYGRVIIQNASANANKAVLNITGGIFHTNGYKTDVLYVGGSNGATGDITASVSGGVFNGEILSSVNEGFISGGIFREPVAEEFCVEGYIPAENADGTYGVKEDPAYGMVAKVGDTYYKTLAEAIAAANGAEIEILCDISESFAAIENVTLFTNVAGGVTITNTFAGNDWVDFNNVTLKSGVTLITPDILINGAVEGGCLNIIEGTLVAGITTNTTTFYQYNDAKTIVRNGGKIIVTGDTVLRNNYETDSGIYIYGDGDDSTVEYSCGLYAGGYIGAYSGTFYAEDAVINAGGLRLDFKKGSSEEADKYAAINAAFKDSILNVTSELRLYKDAHLTLNGTSVTAGKVQVRENATPFVSMDSTSVIKASSVENLAGAILNAVLGADGTVTFKKMVAKIGNTSYESLAAALAVAQEGQTIVLLQNVKLTGKLTITKGITIDGNGHSIIADETAVWYTVSGKLNIKSYETHLIGVNANGITLKNVTLDCNDNAAGINIYCAQNVTFDNVQIINATKGMAALTVNGSTLTLKNKFSALGNGTALDISNGSGVTSNLGVTVEAGTVFDLGNKTVKFASVAVNDMYGAVDANGNPYFAAYDSAYFYTKAQMESRTIGYNNGLTLMTDVELSKDVTIGSTLNLNGHDFTIVEGKILKVSSKLTVTGEGELDADIVLTSAAATLTGPEGLNVTTTVDGCMVKYENGIYRVVNAVAKIGDTYYETLAEALKAAQSGDTVTLLKDVADLGTTVIPAGVTFDGNGHKISGTSSIFVGAIAGAEVTIKNLELDTTGNSIWNEYLEGKLTITGCTFTNSGWDSIQIIPMDGAQIVIEDNEFVNAAQRYVHIQSASTGVDFSATVSGNKMHNGASGISPLDVYWFTDTDKINLGGNYIAPELVGNICVLAKENGKQVNRMEEALPLMDADLVNELKYAAVIKTTYNGTFYTSLQAAMNAAAKGDVITLLQDVTGNVTVNKSIVLDGNGHSVTGKVSVSGSDITVKNLKVKNAGGNAMTVSGGNILIENCEISGNNGLRSCYANNGNVTIKDCIVTGNTYGIHFDGGNGEGKVVIEGCAVTGWTSFGSAIEGVTITDTKFEEGNYNYLRFYQSAEIDGCTFNEKMGVDVNNSTTGAKLTISDSVVENGNIMDIITLDDAVHNDVYIDGEKITVVATVTDSEGVVSYYLTLAEAVDAAKAGDTITLLTDVELTEALVVGKDQVITLDLNGKTLSYTSDIAGEDMITNRGDLTITGEGTITYCNTDTTGSNVTVSTISSEAGSKLTVLSGTITNTSEARGSSGIYAYAIDALTNGNLGAVTVNINGGKIISNYMAIRLFNNSKTDLCTLNITGGEIYGDKRAVQIHLDNATSVLNISGGKIAAGEDGYALCSFSTDGVYSITGGDFTGWVYSRAKEIISGGTYSYDVTENCVEGYMAEETSEGVWGIDTYIALNVNTGKKYDTAYQALMEAYGTGATIKLVNDSDEMGVMVPAGVTLDLNGNTLKVMMITAIGNVVDNSEGRTGFLAVTKGNVALSTNNPQLPVYNGNGYYFTSYDLNEDTRLWDVTDGMQFWFQTEFDEETADLIVTDIADLQVKLRITWTDSTGKAGSQDIVYTADMVERMLTNSTWLYVTVKNYDDFSDVKFTVVVSSVSTGVEMLSNAYYEGSV